MTIQLDHVIVPSRDRRSAASFLGGIALLAVAAPWLPLRDPAAQPDTLVLRERPPLARIDLVHLAVGRSIYADAVERRELALGKGRRAFEHRVDHIAVRATGQVADADHGIEDETLVADRGGEAHKRVP